MDRRTLLKAGLATTAGGLLIPATDGLVESAEAAPRVTKAVARNLSTPWGIAFLPNGDALVGERDSGKVHHVRKTGGRHLVGRLNVRSEKANWGEGGLLGLALSPSFRNDRWVYAYISTGSDNRIVRLRYRDGALGRPHVILGGIPTNTHHNGGRLVFHGGLLYASTGDAENGERAQNRRSLGGKILRMTPDGRVPQGNPFGNYTWSYGHRNVEGIAFDHKGNLWASEFGDQAPRRAEPDREGRQLRLAARRRRRRSRRVPRPAHHLAARELLAERDRDRRWPGVHRRATRSRAVGGAALRHARGSPGAVLPRAVRPDPHGAEGTGRFAVDHDEQPRRTTGPGRAQRRPGHPRRRLTAPRVRRAGAVTPRR